MPGRSRRRGGPSRSVSQSVGRSVVGPHSADVGGVRTLPIRPSRARSACSVSSSANSVAICFITASDPSANGVAGSTTCETRATGNGTTVPRAITRADYLDLCVDAPNRGQWNAAWCGDAEHLVRLSVLHEESATVRGQSRTVGPGTEESSPATRQLGVRTESLTIGCCVRLHWPSTGCSNVSLSRSPYAAAAASCATAAWRNLSTSAAR